MILERDASEELARRWGLPKWRYVNSGSEATMHAIRIARGIPPETARVNVVLDRDGERLTYEVDPRDPKTRRAAATIAPR